MRNDDLQYILSPYYKSVICMIYAKVSHFQFLNRQTTLLIANSPILTCKYTPPKETTKIKITAKMPPNEDFRSLYDNKCIEFDELSDQFNELQEQSTLIMNDLEDEIKDLKRKNQLMQRQVKDLKQKKKYIASTIERQLDQAQKQKNEFKNRFKDFQKKVIELEIINQDLQNQLRATKSTLEEYQASAERTMEQLAILRVELQESTSSNQQQIARLMQQLKQTEQEITIMHQRGKASETHLHIEQNHKETQSHLGSAKKEKIIGTPTSIKQAYCINGQNQNNPQTVNKKDVFKETMSNMRNYMQNIDKKMEDRRKALLNHKQQVLRV